LTIGCPTNGKEVTRFQKGDNVYGFTGFVLGAYGEYCCMPKKASLVVKPVNSTYQEAAAVVDGATTALFFLRDKGKIERGNKVLIIGASGGIGSSAVQIANYFGAQVTGVCSTANVELVKSLGADKVLDYEGLLFIKKLIEEGKLKPIIDRYYSMDQIAEAHRYVEAGHKKGNVVITMRNEV